MDLKLAIDGTIIMSENLKDALDNEEIAYQLVPPYCHRTKLV